MDKYSAAEAAFKNGVADALKDKHLRPAICYAVQATPFRCDATTRALCELGSGDCHFCSTIADGIRKEILKQYDF